MTKRFLLVAVSALFFQVTKAQTNYWQQRVNHLINVTLDDKNHVLRGAETIVYENHSPDTLRFIYIQLYPNAYSRKNTAFAKEQIKNGKLDFQKADADKMGFIDSLSFTANDKPATLEIDAVNPDYAKLFLPTPLPPNEAVILRTPFHYKINHTFSRGGHVGQSYQISQWFPKPSVYDKNGWHPLPYLDNGEYYAEFGDYEVNITLPANYLVGATGTLQTQEEKDWLFALAASYEKNLGKSSYVTNPLATDDNVDNASASFPTSSKNFKTLQYRAWNVQDFAWFADKRFYVLKSDVQLHSDYNGWKEAGNKKVDTWAFFHSEKRKNFWKHATRYIDSSVYYYSKWVGDYAHPQATAVEGALLAGGGMEYPMVTVIGDMPTARLLENVIAHEVGHNWFQGMLGSNERDHPWMDEGINSYYEQRYMKITAKTNPPSQSERLQEAINALTNIQDSDLPYLFQARRNYEQPTCSRAPDFSQTNLGIMVYMKTPLIFEHLESYIGEEGVDTLVQQYFRQYKFKHPQPEDLRKIFDASGVELDWLFDDLLCSTKHVDYKLTKAGDTAMVAGTAFHKIGVKNKGGVKAPFSISAYNEEGNVIATKRYGGFLGKQNVLFTHIPHVAAFRLDAEERMIEYRRQDNTMRKRGILKSVEPLKFRLFTGLENPYRTTVNVAPAVGYNLYDGWQLGLALHNFRAPMNNFEWALVPMYATQRATVSGLARVDGYVYPEGLQHLRLHAMFSTFGYDRLRLSHDEEIYRYFFKSTGGAEVRFKTNSFRKWSTLGVKGFFIENNRYKWTIDDWPPFEIDYFDYFVSRTDFELKYSFQNQRPINPFGLTLKTRFLTEGSWNNDNHQLDATGEFNYRFSYTRRKGFDIRVFGGLSTEGIVPLQLGATPGYYDMTYSHYFVGRSEASTEGFYAQQVTLDQGGLKYTSPRFLIEDYGHGGLVTSVNLKSSLPVPLFILFADAGVALPYDQNPDATFAYTAGIGLRIIPNVCEIYLPLLFSDELKTQVIKPYRTDWYERIVFTLQFENLDPFKLLRNANF